MTGTHLPSAWLRLSGAEFIESLAGQAWDAPHVQILGYRIVACQPGRVTMEWQVPQALLNPAGIAHGGFLAALLDDAAGMAAASQYPRFVPQLTISMHTDFVAPVLPGMTHRVEGELVRGGRGSSLSDARILDPDGNLLARASGVFQPNRRIIPRDEWEAAGLA